LKEIAEVFNHLGLLSPVIISGKIFLQDLWKRNQRWDEELKRDDLYRWITIQTELKKLSHCQIPRSVAIVGDSMHVDYKLLCFCDASINA